MQRHPHEPQWTVARTAYGREAYHYASPRAQRLWYYVRCIGRANNPPGWNMGRRAEDGFLLHFIVRGAMWHRIRERTHIVRAREACLFDLGDEVTYGNEPNVRCQLLWVWFNGKDMPMVFRELCAHQNPVFSGFHGARVESLLRELMAMTIHQPPAYEARASSVLAAILAELFACRSSETEVTAFRGAARPLSDAVRKGVDYITRYYDAPISVKMMAGAAGLSLHYFSRLFRREVGQSPVRYLHWFRVERAKPLLAHSNHSIERIARSVGFPDPRYFGKIFARLEGTSPRLYRQQGERKARSRPGHDPSRTRDA